MLREPRAVLFDLDDTLYPHRRFRFSGLRAVAAHAAATWGVDGAHAVRVVASAARSTPGRELQALAASFGQAPDVVPALLAVFRAHQPDLRMPAATLATLGRMRRTWRIGVVTNGCPAVQARKVDALGLRAHVDAVVFAHATGTGCGKPAPEPFLDACMRLGVTPARTVFVGDDLTCDIDGARRLGMKTIWIRRAAPAPAALAGDLTLRSVAAVPIAAERLLPTCWSPYAA